MLSGVAGGDGSVVHVEVTPRQAVAGKRVVTSDTSIAAAAQCRNPGHAASTGAGRQGCRAGGPG